MSHLPKICSLRNSVRLQYRSPGSAGQRMKSCTFPCSTNMRVVPEKYRSAISRAQDGYHAGSGSRVGGGSWSVAAASASAWSMYTVGHWALVIGHSLSRLRLRNLRRRAKLFLRFTDPGGFGRDESHLNFKIAKRLVGHSLLHCLLALDIDDTLAREIRRHTRL